MKTIMGFHLTNAAKLSNDWGPPLFLPRLFTLSDLAARIKKVAANERQAMLDGRALNLANRYLQDTVPPSDIKIEDLKDAIHRASGSVKSLVFYQAQRARQEGSAISSKRGLIQRAIPVFEALTDSDAQEVYHRNRVQLAFSLKDNPGATEQDLQRAVDLLTKAIEIRDLHGEPKNTLIEFNRAVCRIRLDPDFKASQPSKPVVRDAILADLKAAKEGNYSDSTVDQWLRLNKTAP